MNHVPDDDLRRLFATDGSTGADEVFVARINAEVARQRRWQAYRRSTLSAAAAIVALALAVTLAPIAPGAGDALSLSLLRLPDLATGAALQEVARPGSWQLRTNPWLYFVVVAAVLPLAGTAWLVRRGGSLR
jgi:hypothetical protein